MSLCKRDLAMQFEGRSKRAKHVTIISTLIFCLSSAHVPYCKGCPPLRIQIKKFCPISHHQNYQVVISALIVGSQTREHTI